MPARPGWFLRLPEILDEIQSLGSPVLDRALMERIFGLRRRSAIDLLHRFGGYQSGKTFLIDRVALLEQLEGLIADPDYRQSKLRRERLVESLDRLRRLRAGAQVRIAPPHTEPAGPDMLPEGLEMGPGRLTVTYESPEDLLAKLYALAQAAATDYEGFRAMLNKC